MNSNEPEEDKLKALRDQAEQRLQETKSPGTNQPLEEVIHNLQVYQIELELQQEQLQRTQVELTETRDQYLDLFEAAPVGYVLLDRQGIIQRANQTLGNLLDVDAATLAGKKLLPYINPAYRDDFYRHRRSIFTQQTAHESIRLVFQKADGDPFTAQVSCTYIPSRDLCHMAVLDMTAQAQAEEAYYNLAHHSVQGLVILVDGRPVFANDVMANILGYRLDEYLNLSAEEHTALIHPDYRKYIGQDAQDSPAGKAPQQHYEVLATHKNGHPVWLDMHTSQTVYRGLPAMQAAVNDITERKEAEAALQELNDTLEARVQARTSELSALTQHLTEEVQARREAEANLKQREQDMRSLLENSVDFISRLARDSTHLYVNPALALATGLTPEEIIGKTNAEIGVPGPVLEQFDAVREQVFDTGKPADLTFEYDFDGQRQSMYLRLSPEFNAEGEVVTVLAITRNITERTRLEQEREESIQKLKAIFDHALEGILMVGDDTRYVEVNPAACRMLGYTREEILTMSIQDIVLPAPDEALFVAWDAFQASKTYAGLYPLRRADGTMLMSEARAVANVLPGLHMSIFRDVSEEYETQKALQASETLLRTLVNTAPASIMVLKEGRVVFCNQFGAAMLGYDAPDEITGRSLLELIVPEHQAKAGQWLEQVGEDHKHPTTELLMLTREGTALPVETLSAAIVYEGEPAILLFSFNLTERKEAEVKALAFAVEQAKVKAVDEFLTDAAHDLRTPLSTMRTSLYLLRRRGLRDEQIEQFDRLESSTERLSTLLDEMFNLVHLELSAKYNFKTLHINQMVESVFEEYQSKARAKEQTLLYVPGQTLPTVKADMHYLRQAISEIVQNALLYTPKGGSITLRTQHHPGKVVVHVEDTGIGIPPEALPHIFKRFYRGDEARGTSQGGTGLGLAIADKIITAHNGSIHVTSTPGRGTTCYVRLPVIAQA